MAGCFRYASITFQQDMQESSTTTFPEHMTFEEAAPSLEDRTFGDLPL
jgi:hypothetical protein